MFGYFHWCWSSFFRTRQLWRPVSSRLRMPKQRWLDWVSCRPVQRSWRRDLYGLRCRTLHNHHWYSSNQACSCFHSNYSFVFLQLRRHVVRVLRVTTVRRATVRRYPVLQAPSHQEQSQHALLVAPVWSSHYINQNLKKAKLYLIIFCCVFL